MSNVPTTTETVAEARARWLANLRKTAAEFAQGAPLSIPQADVQRAIDRCILAFRAMANANPVIFQCTPTSVAICLSKCALTGLMPGGANPEVDLIPRKGRVKVDGQWTDGPYELNWQIGFRGYITLAARAGCHVKPVPVFIGDVFSHEEGLDSVLRHIPQRNQGDRGFDDIECVYVVIKYNDGHKDFRVIDRSTIERHREYSEGWKSFKNGYIKSTPWSTSPIPMAMKTAIRYAAARGDIALDDVARYAVEQDAEDTIERNVVATVEVAPASAPKAIAEQQNLGGLDGLAADYEEPEKARVEAPSAQEQHEIKAQADAKAANEATAKAKAKAEADAKFAATAAAEKKAAEEAKAAKKKAKEEEAAKKKAADEAAAKAAAGAKPADGEDLALTNDEMVDLAEELRQLESDIGAPKMINVRSDLKIPMAASIGTLVKDAPRTAVLYAKEMAKLKAAEATPQLGD